MSERILANKRIRKNFGKIEKIIDIPDLIEVQRESYSRFLQMDVPPEKRRDIGLQSVYKSVFPIKDFTGSASLEFVSYRFAEVNNSIKECINRGMTYEIPVRITVRLVVYDIDNDTGVTNIRDIKEQEIYFGTIPLMTDNGTFIINGTERVVVSQLHRSSGVFFDHDKGKTHSSGKVIYSSRIIPVRGSWIDMEIDHKGIVHIRIDRRRKFPITILYKAIGYTSEDILAYFYKTEKFVVRDKRIFKKFNEDSMRGQRASSDIKDPETGEPIIQKGRMFTKAAIKKIKSTNLELIPISVEDVLNMVFAKTIVNPDTGETIVKCNQYFNQEILQTLIDAGINKFELLFIDGVTSSDSIHKTLILDKVETKEDALIEIYRRLRPGNPATLEVAQEFIDHMFFKSSYYDLSGVGRMKINIRLGINSSIDLRTLRKEDILLTAKTLVKLKDTQGAVDDIDHLGNRRVRAVGELLENQYRIGLVRMERAIKERMSLQEVDALMPHDLANSKPVSAVVKEFFGTSQLSQFMDQTNPLSETTHKRRLSALGPGGLTRERAGFEVRDVHPSHYGRICPIETPEGPNIGLIVSLSTYARVNEYGFIETSYSIVKDSKVLQDVKFLSAFEEKDHPIAQANAPLDENRRFVKPLVTSRVGGEFMMVKSEDIELMDISPNQLVSVSASLIPFLENDDANRALMGSNMQRQAVPLLVSQAPLVGTGVEGVVAKDSGVTVVAKRGGTVVDVEASRIVLKHEAEDDKNSEIPVTVYQLSKFIRSNQNTCFNQRPIVRKGQKVKAGEIIADGPATEKGELALGKNIMVAFMPWGGYNFEDSILVGERIHRDGVYTSVHIEEFEVMARDTKLGKEEITRDIPNLGEEALKDLDESGIIRIGAKVKAGDVLVGKITPKGETQLSPEEKLLRAIFGEKAKDVQDTSLRVLPGVEGTVIDVKVFNRKGVDKDERTRLIENEERARLLKDQQEEITILKDSAKRKIKDIVIGKVSAVKISGSDKKIALEKNQVITESGFARVAFEKLKDIRLKEAENEEAKISEVLDSYEEQINLVNMIFETKINRIKSGDELPPGVIKMVKVYIAVKRHLSVGDKMAGRHGNKGVLSRILPKEDMPFLEDGTPVEIVLNPLGVPSRMNVGQILETHLGWAAKGLGYKIAGMMENGFDPDNLREQIKKIYSNPKIDKLLDSLELREVISLAEKMKEGVYMSLPVFEGASEEEITRCLTLADLPADGQTILFDGRTGEAFDKKITVGVIYMMKLHHLVEDKIHARSIGTYSLVTQQPLGGKAQFGGQRLGEMEVWALEAYGAAYTLQEFLTVKSDDVWGRTKMYEKVVKGENILELGIPESFNVLIRELQGLCLNVKLIEGE